MVDTNHDAAVDYAQRGWAVFPLVSASKVPAIKGGFKLATTDASQADAWWSQHPSHNVGIATGQVSGGLVVLDIDADDAKGEDDMNFIREWEAAHGELPETVTAITGRGGYHFYYRADAAIGCSVNAELGVDVRADGGFVVAPPSTHPNGNAYEWENHPDDYDVAEADDNVLALIDYVQTNKVQRSGGSGGRFALPENIPAGERDDTLFRYACSLQAQGYDDDYIAMAVDAANGERCDPPMTKADVSRIVGSATSRYDKGGGTAAASPTDPTSTTGARATASSTPRAIRQGRSSTTSWRAT